MGIFECQNIELKLGNKIILHNYNFSFNSAGFVMIEGENGVGKSSVLKTFAGFISPQKGQILFNGKSVDQIGRGDFSFFSTTSLGLMSEFTGREHIQIIANALNIKDDIVQEKINHFMSIEIFSEILDKKSIDYSQGMRQFLRLFLHLFFSPKFIFLDEPFLFLSPRLKDFIKEEVEILARKSLVFITDQHFNWVPQVSTCKISLGGK